MNDLTVCIPIFNGAKTIAGVLERLTMQRMGSPLSVFIYDNGSTDGTNGMLGEVVATGYWARKTAQDRTSLDIKYFKGTHTNDHPYINAQRTRKLCAKIVQTPYVFFLDADVILPPSALYMLMDEFKRAEGVGAMGIRYEADCNHNHVMAGAVLYKKEVFDNIPEFTVEDLKKGCDCLFCVKEVEKQGLKSVFHPSLMGYHCKYF